MKIKKVVVIGSGTMGSGIAAQLCNANIPVTLLDLKTEISEKEKRYRNLLGLKSRGVINVALLKSNFEERAKNYSDSKLEGMNSAKRRQALEKKDRLDRAYEYLMDQASK